jgi:hypothetical protein
MRSKYHSLWRRLIIPATALGLTAISLNAAAAEADDSARLHARELMTRGREERTKSDLRAALRSFTEADELMHVPTTGFEVAQTLTALGMLVEATAVTQRILALPEAPDEPEVFAKARQSTKELGAELAARTPSMRVTSASSSPEPTRLTLDGKPLDSSAASEGIRVNPGRHVVVAEQAGGKRQRVLDVAEKASVVVTLDFAPTDGASRHGGGAEPRRRFSSSKDASMVAVYGLTGLAVVGGGTGLAFALVSNHRKAELERICAPQCNQSAIDQLRTRYIIANVAAGVGAAAAIAAVTVYLVRPHADSKDRHAVTSLSLAANAGVEPGVSLAGSF